MNKLIALIVLLSAPAFAMEKWQGWCEQGAHKVVTQGLQSAKPFQQSFPNCTATIYSHGVVSPLPLIYLDNLSTPTPEANPITANNDGTYMFYAPNGRYDIVLTGGGLINPTTINDVLLCDPQDPTGAFGCAGGASTPISIQHNGTFVGTEPIVNIIDTATVVATVADNPGQTRVDVSNAAAGGGGGGCTLAGIPDLAVLLVHPLATCFGNGEFTWDPTNILLQASDGTTTMTGMTKSMAIGDANILASSGAGSQGVLAYGRQNNLAADIQGDQDVVVAGGYNVLGGTHNYTDFILGDSNRMYNSKFTTIINFSNTVGTSGGGGLQQFGTVAGYLNDVNNSGGGAGNLSDFSILGDFNSINATTAKTASGVIAGFTNHIDARDGSNGGAFIYGLDNASHGGQDADVVIVGSSNTVNSILGTGTLGADDNFVAGFLNTSFNSGNFTMFGGNNLLACTVCSAVGFNLAQSTNNSIAIGISTVPEMTIKQGNVRLTPVGVTNGPVINAFRTSGGTVTSGTLGQTCNVAFTGGAGSGGTGVMYVNTANSPAGGILAITAGGSYTSAPTGGTLSSGTATCSGSIVATTTIGLVPACSSSTEGSTSPIVDSTTNTYGATITGGGSTHVLGYCNGTNWTVMGAGTGGGGGAGAGTFVTADGTGTPPTNYQVLTAGSNVTLTPGSHTLTVAASGGGGGTFQKASVHANVAQSISGTTLINVDTVDFDPAGIVDTVNHRIKPTLSGYYMVTGSILNNAQASFGAVLTKNGTNFMDGSISGNTQASSVSGIVFLNGSTDYVDIRASFITGSGTTFIVANSNNLQVVGPF